MRRAHRSIGFNWNGIVVGTLPERSDPSDKATKFVGLLTAHQRDLYLYINTLLAGDSAVSDVLQDTNLDLWARLEDFDFERPFLPWAYGFAYQRVLAFRKSRGRSRLVFSDEISQLISDVYLNDPTPTNQRLAALQECLNKLDPSQSELIRERYVERISVQKIAERLGHTANQVSARLYRIRRALAKCVESVLGLEAKQ